MAWNETTAAASLDSAIRTQMDIGFGWQGRIVTTLCRQCPSWSDRYPILERQLSEDLNVNNGSRAVVCDLPQTAKTGRGADCPKADAATVSRERLVRTIGLRRNLSGPITTHAPSRFQCAVSITRPSRI